MVRRSMRLIRLLLFSTCLPVLLSDTASAWQQLFDGGGSADDAATAVAVDASGNVVAAGRATGAHGTDFAVVKRAAADGGLAWPGIVEIDGSAHGDDAATAVAVDAAGNVVAAGYLATTGGARDLAVVKLDGGDGHELWRRVIAGAFAGGDDEASAVAIDGNGDVLVAGFTQETATHTVFAVVKLSGTTGTLAWPAVVKISGSAGSGNTATSIAADAAGNAIAGGFTSNTGQGIDFTVVKLAAADGAQLWLRALDGGSHAADVADAVAVDVAGNVFASGFVTVGGTTAFAVAGLAGSNGTALWSSAIVTVPGTGADFGGEARAIAADRDGHVVAAGVIDDTATDPDRGLDFSVVAFDAATGSSLWRHDVKGTGVTSLSDDGRGVAVDPAGNVAATGVVENADEGDLVVVELARGDGHEFWRATVDGGAGADVGNAIAVDRQGNVAAAGAVATANDGGDFAVVRYGCAGGDPVVCPPGDACHETGFCDPATAACAVGRDICATTTTTSPTTTSSTTTSTTHASTTTVPGTTTTTHASTTSTGATTSSTTSTVTTSTAASTSSSSSSTIVATTTTTTTRGATTSTTLGLPGPCSTEGAACDDGDPCTETDTCHAGVCTADALESAVCAVTGALSEPACANDKVPAGVTKLLKRAGTILRAAASTSDAKKRAHLLTRAGGFLRRAAKAVDRAAAKKKSPLSPACAGALRAAIASAQARVAELRA
jgi:hypothetical protein